MHTLERSPFGAVGFPVSHTVAALDALQAGGLDWRVEKQPLFAGESREPVPNRQAVVRTDTNAVLGIVSTNYPTIQNRDGLAMLDAILDAGNLTLETVGEYRGGRTVWIQTRIPEDITIGGDPHIGYLIWATSHDGSSAMRLIPATVRVHCGNMLPRLSRGSGVWRIAHRGKVDGRIAEARSALNVAYRHFDAFAAEVAALQAKKITDHDFERIKAVVIPNSTDPTLRSYDMAKTKRESIHEEWDALEIDKHTAWGAVQAVNTWAAWSRSGRGTHEERIVGGVITGRGDAYTRRALAAVSP